MGLNLAQATDSCREAPWPSAQCPEVYWSLLAHVPLSKPRSPLDFQPCCSSAPSKGILLPLSQSLGLLFWGAEDPSLRYREVTSIHTELSSMSDLKQGKLHHHTGLTVALLGLLKKTEAQRGRRTRPRS